jgi:hypothetical protein
MTPPSDRMGIIFAMAKTPASPIYVSENGNTFSVIFLLATLEYSS